MTSDEQLVRFVVLRHDHPSGLHYDLMIEQDEALATWRCATTPESVPPGGLELERIGDHRCAYLDYEGPVSGDRGSVARHDAGRCGVAREPSGTWSVHFQGEKLTGHWRLEPEQGSARQSWRLRAVAKCGPSG